jgi:predicted nucleic acid-binding protein
MIFTDLPAGEAVFLDANTLLYHFTADPKHGAACTDLVERIERQQLNGFTSTHVVSEVAHRLMTVEASWGIHGKPVGVERLRALMEEECGANPEDNAFSRELIELREERRS